MNIKRISPYPDHCSVTLDIPWEVADALVTSGPELISNLKVIVNQHKEKVEQDELLNSLRNQNVEKPEYEWWPLAVKADKRIQSLIKKDGLTPPKALSVAAKEFHFPHSSMMAILSVHRELLKEETAKLRTLEIIQLHFKGISSHIIADHLEINIRTVQRTLKENGDIVEFARSELKELLSDKFCRQGVMSEAVLREEGRGSPRPTTSLKKPLLNDNSSRRQAETNLSADTYFDQRKEDHRKLGIQFYRQYRQTLPDLRAKSRAGDRLQEQAVKPGAKRAERIALFIQLGMPHDLTAIYIEHLIRARRIKVQAYLKNRRLNTIIRLRAEKLSYAKIAPIVQLNIKTVQKIFHEYEASQKAEVSHD